MNTVFTNLKGIMPRSKAINLRRDKTKEKNLGGLVQRSRFLDLLPFKPNLLSAIQQVKAGEIICVP